MRAKLTFKLPEEQIEFEEAQKGTAYRVVLQELDCFLRAKVKYAPDSQKDEVTKAFQEARDRLTELMNERDLGLY